MSETVLITGANRGIGLEFTRQYAKAGAQVLACCRHPNQANELQLLQQKYPNIQLYRLDVTEEADILALKKAITHPIDILINNAGMLVQDQPLGQVSIESLTQCYYVNAISPLKMVEAFIAHLSRGQHKVIACLSSSMGSISDNTSGGYYSYRASKTALNMLMVSVGHDLAETGIKVVLLHPGWVKTQMGGEHATTEPEQSVSGMRKIIANYNPPHGEVMFYRYNGEIVAW